LNSAAHDTQRHLSDVAALAATVVIGAMLSAQARINGELGKHTGSVMAAAVSFGVGFVALAIAVTASRQARVGLRRLGRVRIKKWWLLGGVFGAAVVASSAAAVPEVGVSLVTVLIVAGTTTGGLAVDAVGAGPAGRVAVSPVRLAGVALAVVAVCIGAIGQHGTFRPALLALVGAAGVASAWQQAANGQLRASAEDARVAALVNFVVGLLALGLLTAVLAITGHFPTIHWSHQPGLYIGGLLGVVYIAVAAALVGRLGVLRLTLGAVSGQVVGALLIDVIAPTPGLRLTVATVVGALLTLVAVGITVRSR
jgi:transporter family-2 protein